LIAAAVSAGDSRASAALAAARMAIFNLSGTIGQSRAKQSLTSAAQACARRHCLWPQAFQNFSQEHRIVISPSAE
jgi:hypothetical protein